MGVMCSLLGHDYGDPGVERERVEEGDEVVLTAKRVERCRSCGHERTLSENTEVTALSAAAGVVRKADGTVVATMDESNGVDATTESGSNESGSDDAEPEEMSPRPMGESNRNETGSVSDGTGESPEVSDEPESTGGVIVDSVTTESALDSPNDGVVRTGTDGTRSTEMRSDGSAIDRIAADEPVTRDRPRREPGEWPAEPESPTRAPPNAFDGSSDSESDDRVASRVTHWPGETPTTNTDDPHTDGAHTDAVGARTRKGGRAGATADGGRTLAASFACPSCGFDAVVADSPLRAGDICPECHGGYLARETRKG